MGTLETITVIDIRSVSENEVVISSLTLSWARVGMTMKPAVKSISDTTLVARMTIIDIRDILETTTEVEITA